MPTTQLIFGFLLFAFLAFFGLKGIRNHWNNLKITNTAIEGEKKKQKLIQWLRFSSALLMFCLGIMLFIAMLLLEGPAQNLADLSDAADLSGKKLEYSPEQWQFATRYAFFWLGFLLILLLLVLLGAFDAVLSYRQISKLRQQQLKDLRDSGGMGFPMNNQSAGKNLGPPC